LPSNSARLAGRVGSREPDVVQIALEDFVGIRTRADRARDYDASRGQIAASGRIAGESGGDFAKIARRQ
jgi:hypothetical protein